MNVSGMFERYEVVVVNGCAVWKCLNYVDSHKSNLYLNFQLLLGFHYLSCNFFVRDKAETWIIRNHYDPAIPTINHLIFSAQKKKASVNFRLKQQVMKHIFHVKRAKKMSKICVASDPREGKKWSRKMVLSSRVGSRDSLIDYQLIYGWENSCVCVAKKFKLAIDKVFKGIVQFVGNRTTWCAWNDESEFSDFEQRKIVRKLNFFSNNEFFRSSNI